MKYLPIGLLVAAVCLPAPASAGELALSFKDGRVTLKATDVTLRQVLNEWARLGQTRIVGLEKLGGGLLTLELTNLPEKQALEILLRSVAGYAAAPRASVAAGATWPPTSRASIGSCCCRQASPRRRPWHLPDPQRRLPRHRKRHFRIRFNWPTRRLPMPRRARTLLACRSSIQMASRWRRRSRAFRAGRCLASFARRAGRSECPGAGQRSHTAWCGTAGHDTPRRDSRAADATAPVSAGWVYSLPT